MTNISDVAKLANVSTMTVSRVVNNSGYVKVETRKKVELAMKELNYHPNYLARSLVEQKTLMLALVVPDITNPFYTSVARGTEDVARERGYRVILCNSDESTEKEGDYIDMCISIRVDGMVIAGAGDHSRESLEKFQTHNIPLVLLDREIPGINADLVTGDNIYGSYSLVKHLISLGHRRIAILTGSLSTSTSRQRLDGYRLALQDAGVPYTDSLVFETSYTRSSKSSVVEKILMLPERPTAIFAGNNFVATGIIQELRNHDLRVPEDFSIVCFDDIDPMSLAEPFLTVAMQPAYEFGTRATQILLERVAAKNNPQAIPLQKLCLKPQILIRRSSGHSVRQNSRL